MSGFVWDAENDTFVQPLHCPHCGAPSPVVPDAERESAWCPFCSRPFELVRVVVGEGQGALSMTIPRRPQLAWCSATGERLHRPSLLDWAGANGSASRSGTVVDPRGLLFGEPHRDVCWDLRLQWTQSRFGHEDASRPDEVITSVSVWKGVVVAVTASGVVGLFDPDSGVPLLAHAISWPGVDLEDDDHARAVRLPPGLRDMTLVLGTDRTVLVRDMAPALSVPSSANGRLFTALPAPPGQQWIGAPLMAGHAAPHIVLLRGTVSGGAVHDGVIEVVVGAGPALGEPLASVPAGDIARPPVWSARSRVVLWVSKLGHVSILDVDKPGQLPRLSLPRQMLALPPVERPLLLVVDGGAHQDTELWLADDSDGLSVWRAQLSQVLGSDSEHGEWAWEPLLHTRDVGSLRSLAVGPASRAGTAWAHALASQLFVVSTERSTAAFARALKSNASDSVLARVPIAPPVLTPVGYLSQDRQGLWLRSLGPWSLVDDNPERFLDPGIAETRPAFYDRTFAVAGRQVFFAHAGRVQAAQLVPRRAHAAAP
jgi:hypothetical protein